MSLTPKECNHVFFSFGRQIKLQLLCSQVRNKNVLLEIAKWLPLADLSNWTKLGTRNVTFSWIIQCIIYIHFIMTSSNENLFCVTGHLCGEFNGDQWTVTRSIDVFFDMSLKNVFSTQSWGWWFETPSRLLWRQFKVNFLITYNISNAHD